MVQPSHALLLKVNVVFYLKTDLKRPKMKNWDKTKIFEIFTHFLLEKLRENRFRCPRFL